MFLFGNKKKRDLQKTLDNILQSDQTKLEMTNEIQKLFKSDPFTFCTLSIKQLMAVLGDYILSNQWDREKADCWDETSQKCVRKKIGECVDYSLCNRCSHFDVESLKTDKKFRDELSQGIKACDEGDMRPWSEIKKELLGER